MTTTDDFTDVVNSAIARHRAYQQQAAALSPQQTSALSSIADTWPQMDPGLVLPLGKAGLMGDHPIVQQTAISSAQQKASTGQLSKPGTVVTGRALKKTHHSGGILGSITHALSFVNPFTAGAASTNLAVEHPAIAEPFKPVGDAAAAVSSNPVVRDVYTGIKGATRVAGATLMTIPDAIQGGWRAYRFSHDPVAAIKSGDSIPTPTDLLTQTQLGAVIEDGVTHGGDFQTGNGLFLNPKSRVGQEQANSARAFGLINGHAVTVGRSVAATVTEPGTRPYNVLSGLLDAGVQLVGGKPVSKVGEALRARNVLAGGEAEYVVTGEGNAVPVATFEPQPKPTRDTVNALGMPENVADGYGLVDGLRKTVPPEKAVTWLNSMAGNRFADFAANSKSFNDIWLATNRKLPVDVVNELVDAESPGQVKQILAGELGTTLREAPSISKAQVVAASGGVPGVIGQAGLKVQRMRNSPLFTLMPHQALDLNNPDQAVTDFDRFQRITKAFNEDEISANNERLARALTGAGGEGAALQAVGHVMDVVGDTLTRMGVPKSAARRSSQLWTNTIQDLRHYNINDIGENVDFPGVWIGDDGLPAPSPHLFVEYLNNHIPLPNVRDLRTAVSTMRRITDSAPAHVVQDVSDFINNNIFKPMVLLRGAWPVRVIGEEQMRMGAAGYSSMVHSPVSYMALLAGSKMPKTSALLSKMGKDALTADVKGTKWADQADEAFSADATEFAQAMSKRGAGYVDPSNGIITRHYPIFTKGVDHGFHLAWTDELRKLSIDPVASRIAKAMDENTPTPTAIERITDWLWNGDGASIRSSLAARWDAAKARNFEPVNNNPFRDRTQVQAYVQSIYDRLLTKTSGHPQLVNAVATGKITGEKLISGGDANPKAALALEQFTDYAPKQVTGPLRVYAKGNSAGAQLAARYNQFVQWGFENLMSKPTNTLSRSPVFRQAYWQRVSELAPYMDAKAATKAAKNAEAADASQAAKALRAGGKGKLTMSDADTIAKKYALDQVQELLYGESKRSNFFDAFRILFPFGDAFREVLTRWAKLVSNNPAIVLRADQIVNAAQQSGFTYTDPQTGKETFVYPGSQQLMQLLTGVPVKLTAQANSLNMVSAQLLPGFGPVAQLAVGELSPNLPGVDELRHVVLPYGEGDTSGGGIAHIGETFLPAWLKKLQASGYLKTVGLGPTPEQQRQLISTTNQVAGYLYSTGDYDISTPDGQQKLLSDARSKAKAIWVLRGMAQFGAPAAPEPQISAKDKNGHLHTIYALQSAYRDMLTKDPTNATADFMATYGPLALMATNPTTSGNFAPTASLYDFVQAHPDLVKKYPTLYGYLAPAGGQFSTPEYQRELASGERVGVTPQENIDITNQRMATAIYNHLKAEVAGRTDQAATEWLSAARDKLAAMYPQFGLKSNPPDQGTVAQQMQRLQAAVQDPEVTATPAGQGLVLYMQAREKALEAAKAQGFATFASAKSAANIRTWLQNVAAQIIAVDPDFQTIYQRVLVHEMPGA